MPEESQNLFLKRLCRIKKKKRCEYNVVWDRVGYLEKDSWGLGYWQHVDL